MTSNRGANLRWKWWVKRSKLYGGALEKKEVVTTNCWAEVLV